MTYFQQSRVWALARSPDLHSNIHQLIASSNTSIQHPIKVPRKQEERLFPTILQPGHQIWALARALDLQLINIHRLVALSSNTKTKSLAKEFSKILIFEYFGYLKISFDVFFDADSESPRMT